MEPNKYMCAPGKKYENNSCFTIDELIKIANEYNKIQKNKDKAILIKNDKKYLLQKLNEVMVEEYNCENNKQTCWLKTNAVNDKNIKNYTFRPEGPKKQFEWLSTSDINKVMGQYEKQYKDFKFFEAVPYDFEILPQLEIYNINFNDMNEKGITKIGMVINLDNHNQSGSHWVALYSVLNENKLYYFDSFGKTPGKRIKKLNKKILKYMHKQNNNTGINKNDELFDIRYNKIQHQFKNSECGVYSMNFIIRLLNNESFDHIINSITKDDKMNDCRNVYFINNNNHNKNLDYCTIDKKQI